MKLRDLKSVIDAAVEYAAHTDPDVEVWVGDKRAYRIAKVCQFGVVPDVTIHVGEKIYDASEEWLGDSCKAIDAQVYG